MQKLYILFLSFCFFKIINAQAVWKGAAITFTKAALANPTDAANQDRITSNVWLTRGNTKGLYNIKKEALYTSTSPNDTEWATGSIDNYSSLTYTNWETWYNKNPTGIINEDAVVHLKSDNIYFSIKFLSWAQGNTGGGASPTQDQQDQTLPITLKGFSGSLNKQNALLKWSTATELDNEYFEIEHSVNGKDFLSIAKVNANGSGTTERSYTYVDENISIGKHFYRIADVDKNGNKRYSQVITLSAGMTSVLQLYPNPAASFISVAASSLLEGNEFTISSAIGQKMLKGVISKQQIDVQKLAPGNYFFSIKTKDGELIKSQFLKK